MNFHVIARARRGCVCQPALTAMNPSASRFIEPKGKKGYNNTRIITGDKETEKTRILLRKPIG
jgi:hypothetical protein